MSPVEREMHALRALASMPFLDALELVARCRGRSCRRRTTR